MTTLFFFLSQGEYHPNHFAENEEDLKKYLDHLNKTGFICFSYDENKAIGFIQEVSIEDSRWEKIKNEGSAYIWVSHSLTSHSPSMVDGFSNNMSNLANQISVVWNRKVSKNHLETQYRSTMNGNPKCVLNKVEDFNVFKLDKIKLY